MKNNLSLRHGGNLLEVASRYNSNPEEWVDLSTGISPFGYPIPNIPAHIFRELPQASAKLSSTIKSYLQSESFVLANGTQAIIQALSNLPIIKSVNRKILVPKVGYKEHQKAWRKSDYLVDSYFELPPVEKLEDGTVLIVINPNNPSGEFFTSELLQDYADRLLQINGWLIVDEAFTEATDENNSLLPFAQYSNTIVLRSIGKFFGLAGIRAGLATSPNKAMVDELDEILGPWHVSGPTQYIVERALGDETWQLEQKERHRLQSEKLMSILLRYFPFESIKGCQLFKTISHSAAEELHELLCTKKIYVRLCDEKDAIRIGLADNEQLEKLELALNQLDSDFNGFNLNDA